MSLSKNIMNEMDVEEQCLPKSTCSIEQNPHTLSNKNIYSHHESSFSHIEDKKDKSMKYIGDRFFPVRKMPCSAKDLFNDHVEWIEDEENDSEVTKRS